MEKTFNFLCLSTFQIYALAKAHFDNCPPHTCCPTPSSPSIVLPSHSLWPISVPGPWPLQDDASPSSPHLARQLGLARVQHWGWGWPLGVEGGGSYLLQSPGHCKKGVNHTEKWYLTHEKSQKSIEC